MNPALTEDDVVKVLEDVAVVLCRCVRIGQASRVLRALRELQAARERQAQELVSFDASGHS